MEKTDAFSVVFQTDNLVSHPLKTLYAAVKLKNTSCYTWNESYSIRLVSDPSQFAIFES